jgi:uncharacterized membrane protein YjjB (DUF3815 family)
MTAAGPAVDEHDAGAPAADVSALLLAAGVALTMTGDAVSEIQRRLRSIAAAYGYGDAHISVLPTFLLVRLHEDAPVGIKSIDTVRQLRLDQSSEVIGVARRAEQADIEPSAALTALGRALSAPPRFDTAARIASHGLLTVGLGLVIRPATADLWVYLVLGRCPRSGSRAVRTDRRVPPPGAGSVPGVRHRILAHDSNEAASLRLTIPPLVTFLPGALLTMATVDLAMGETVTGASRFVAGMLQLALLAIGILAGAELVGDPHTGPVAGSADTTLGAWAPWAGVALFGIGIYIYDSAPRRSLLWLLIVLYAAWIGQLAGKQLVDATLSGFVGAAVMVPIAHLVARAPTAPPAHVMFLPAFWLLVPGTLGLIGMTEIVGDNRDAGSENLATALAAIPSVALGILVGTMIVRAARAATRHDSRRTLSGSRS